MMSLNLFILQSVCPYGFFGHNCAKECKSTCAGCNSVNGSCDLGCIQGWTGYNCNKRDVLSGFYEFNLSEINIRRFIQCLQFIYTCAYMYMPKVVLLQNKIIGLFIYKAFWYMYMYDLNLNACAFMKE